MLGEILDGIAYLIIGLGLMLFLGIIIGGILAIITDEKIDMGEGSPAPYRENNHAIHSS